MYRVKSITRLLVFADIAQVSIRTIFFSNYCRADVRISGRYCKIRSNMSDASQAIIGSLTPPPLRMM